LEADLVPAELNHPSLALEREQELGQVREQEAQSRDTVAVKEVPR
jgi:hypothetical protein